MKKGEKRMKLCKGKATCLFMQVLSVCVSVVLCFGVYNWWNTNDNTCFALSFGASGFLIFCFYSIIFRHERQGMVVYILSGLMVNIFANKLYDYEKLKILFPALKNVDSVYVIIGLLSGVLLFFIFIKVLMYVYSYVGNDDIVATGEKNVTTGQSENSEAMDKRAKNDIFGGKFGIGIFLLLLTGLSMGTCVLFVILYKNGMPQHDYNFFEIVMLLLKYAGTIVMLLLALVVVIVLALEMVRLVMSRIRILFISAREETRVPLYALSAVIDLVICFLAYRVSGVTMNTFYDFVSNGEYLALPLMILVIGVAFAFFMKLTHATLLLMTQMKPDHVKEFWNRIDNRMEINERLEEIIRSLIDIVLDSVIIALKFVKVIPDFADSIRILSFEEESEFEVEEKLESEMNWDTDKKN